MRFEGKLLILLIVIAGLVIAITVKFFNSEATGSNHIAYTVEVSFIDGTKDTIIRKAYEGPYMVSKRRSTPCLYFGHSQVACYVKTYKIIKKVQ